MAFQAVIGLAAAATPQSYYGAGAPQSYYPLLHIGDKLNCSNGVYDGSVKGCTKDGGADGNGGDYPCQSEPALPPSRVCTAAACVGWL